MLYKYKVRNIALVYKEELYNSKNVEAVDY